MIIKADFVAITGPSFEFGYTHSFAPVRYRLPSSSLYLFNYLYLFLLRLRLASVARRNPDGGEASKSACCPRKCISSRGLRGDGQSRGSNHPPAGTHRQNQAQPQGWRREPGLRLPSTLLSPRPLTFPLQTLRPGNSCIPSDRLNKPAVNRQDPAR